MLSTSNPYTETKTVLCMSSFRSLSLALLLYQSRYLQTISLFSCTFWSFSLLAQLLYLLVALKDPGFWPVHTKPQNPSSTFVILVEEHPLADQENIPTVKDECSPANNPLHISENDSNYNKSEQLGTKKPRFCSNCLIHQALRTKHCRDCKRCVSLYDHHCPWVGNCVGQNNRIYFFWYIFVQCCEIWIGGYAVSDT